MDTDHITREPEPVQRGLGRLSARELAIAVAIIVTCLGAAVGVASQAATSYRFGAEAAIALGPGAREADLRRYAAAASLLQVVSGARAAARSGHSAAAIEDNTTVVAVPALRAVLIRVRDVSRPAALALANALAERALEFVRTNLESSPSGARVVGSFEDGRREGWGLARSLFNSRPLVQRAAPATARFGTGALRVACPPARGCGPSRRLYGSFHQGVRYSASGWVRSRSARTRVMLVLGASGGDVAFGRGHKLTASWQPVVARWTPRADSGSAEVGVQSRAAGRVDFEVDGVSVTDPLAAAAARDVAGAAQRPGPSARFVAAAPIDERRRIPAAAALLGAAGGLATAIGALALAYLARRRNVAQALRTPPALAPAALREEPRREGGR